MQRSAGSRIGALLPAVESTQSVSLTAVFYDDASPSLSVVLLAHGRTGITRLLLKTRPLRQGDNPIHGTYVLVGCGQQKQDTDGAVPAKDLYTSSYFSCKQRYADAVSQPGPEAPAGTPGWIILSAKHDVLWPHIAVEPYDTTIDDLRERDAPVAPDAYQHTRYPWDEPRYETALDFWTRRVHFGLASWLGMKSGFPEEDPHCQRLIVLAGDDYVDPLLDNDVFDPFPWVTRFPFQEGEFDGIGEQMQWLVEETALYETDPDGVAAEQADIRTYRATEPAVEVADDAYGQTEWGDWTDG